MRPAAFPWSPLSSRPTALLSNSSDPKPSCSPRDPSLGSGVRGWFGVGPLMWSLAATPLPKAHRRPHDASCAVRDDTTVRLRACTRTASPLRTSRRPTTWRRLGRAQRRHPVDQDDDLAKSNDSSDLKPLKSRAPARARRRPRRWQAPPRQISPSAQLQMGIEGPALAAPRADAPRAEPDAVGPAPRRARAGC